MNVAQQHRGPDDEGVYLGADVGLAFRRLAIVDLSGGRQPMSNEDGRIRLVFNGEIYDHTLLRKALEAGSSLCDGSLRHRSPGPRLGRMGL